MFLVGLFLIASVPVHSEEYLVTFKLHQVHFTLDIWEHVKDAANAVEVTIPVSKTFYNQVTVDQNIVDDFRVGSFLVNGSFGDWRMTVVRKEMKP